MESALLLVDSPPSLGPASVPELLWTAGALVGVVVYVLAYLDARADFLALAKLRRNGLLRALVRMDRRLFGYGTAVQLLFLLVGVTQMITPPIALAARVDGWPILVGRWLVPIAVFVAEFLLILLAFQHQRDRHSQRDEAHRTAVSGVSSRRGPAALEAREGAEGRIESGMFIEHTDPQDDEDAGG